MRFTPTTNWTNFSNSTVKKMQWKVYLRFNTLRSTTLNGSTWSEITSYVTEMPDIKTQNEYEIGVFTADSISIKCNNKKYFKDNWFTGSSPYVEIKVTADIINGTTSTSDTPSLFYGFVDLQNINYVTSNDSVEFSAYTIDELASRIPAENYNEQYVAVANQTDAIMIPGLPGIYVSNSNVSSYPCKVGSHTISYTKESGVVELEFDGGASQTVSASGQLTLVSSSLDEKVIVQIIFIETFDSSDSISGKFIITSANSAFPQNFIYGKKLSDFITGVISQIGIISADVTIDTSTFTTHDSTNASSFLDVPAFDLTAGGARQGVVSDSVYLYFGVGNKIYRKNISTGVYSLYITLVSYYYVKRIWYSDSSDNLYIVSEDAVNPSSTIKLYIYNIATSTVVLNTSTHADFNSSNYSSSAITPIFDSGLGVHGFLYPRIGTNDLRFQPVTGSAYNISIGSVSNLTTANYIHHKDSTSFSAIDIFYSYVVSGSHGSGLINFFSATTYGVVLGYGGFNSTVTCYFSGGAGYLNDYFYYFDSATVAIKRVEVSPATTHATIVTALEMKIGFFEIVNSIIFANDYKNKILYNISGANYTIEEKYVTVQKHSLVYLSDRYYYVDIFWGLFQRYPTLNMVVLLPDYSGLTLRELLSDVCKAYNMTYTITSNKKAYIYRRGTNTGAISTTGNQLDISPSEITDQTRNYKYSSGVELVEVSNGTVTQTYGLTGTGSTLAFGVTRFSDARKLTLSNSFIPSNLVDDLCYYIYQYYSIDRDVYDIPISTSKFEYEPFDGIKFYTEFDYLLSENLDELISEHSEDLIYATDEKSGVIVGQTIQSNGITNFQVVA